jgi:lipid A disaccharide synthetase
MANIVLGRRAVPELLQADLEATAVVDEVAALLEPGSGAAKAQQEAFVRLREELGAPGAFERVADLALEMLDRGPG